MSRVILVEGEEYVVYENLGYVHDVGAYAKSVIDDNRSRIIVSKSPEGPWYFPRTPFVIPVEVRGQKQ